MHFLLGLLACVPALSLLQAMPTLGASAFASANETPAVQTLVGTAVALATKVALAQQKSARLY